MRTNDMESTLDLSDCTGEERTPLPKNTVVAMAYVPFQQYDPRNLYGAEDAFQQGTLFPDLDKPFSGWPGEWK